MNTRLTAASIFLLLNASLVMGCGSSPPPPAPLAAPTALTLEEWKTLPVDLKYDGATFDRLRMNNPQLQNERAWQAYMNYYIIPERKKDIPYAPGQQPP